MSHDERLLELISALVDGELSPDERTRAESLLANDADLRAYHEELLAMRAGLQSLPQYRLPDTFAQQVLRRAEREMLLDPALSDLAKSAGKNGQPATTRLSSAAKSQPNRKWTPWLLVAAGLAAVVTVAIVVQSLNRDPRIAESEPKTNTSDREQSRSADPGANLAQSDPQRSTDQRTDEDSDSNSEPNNSLVNSDNSSSNSDRPPDNGQDNSSSPANTEIVRTTDAPPAGNNVPGEFTDPNLQIPMYAYVFEVVLTSAGIKEDVFQQSLVRHQISLQNAISIDRSMEGTLLSHKYFGGIKPEDLPADEAPGDADPVHNHLQLFFLACTGRQFDDLSQDLMSQQGYVIAVKHDLASATSDMALYSKMQQLASRAENSAEYVGAHPLAMEDDLRNRLVMAVRQSKGIRNPLPTFSLKPPDDGSGAELSPESRQMIEEMEKQVFLILIVLRSKDTVE